MPKVYAPQVPAKFDPGTSLWIPNVNMRTAEAFGELKVCLPNGASRLHVGQLVVALREQMSEVTADDWLIAVGDPSLIAAAAVIMFKKTGGLRILKWDRMMAGYIPVEMTL